MAGPNERTASPLPEEKELRTESEQVLPNRMTKIEAVGVVRTIIEETVACIRGRDLTEYGPLFCQMDVRVLLYEIDRLMEENRMLMQVNLSLQELDRGECREAGDVLRDLEGGVGM